jgi:hypothetical protein
VTETNALEIIVPHPCYGGIGRNELMQHAKVLAFSKLDANSLSLTISSSRPIVNLLSHTPVSRHPSYLPATMKFAVATLTTLTAHDSASSNSEFNLRATTTKSSDPAEAPVVVYGLHEVPAEDLNRISKSIATAYNSAYSATDYSFAALKTKMSVSVPDKVGFTRSFCSGCRWCANSRARCRH